LQKIIDLIIFPQLCHLELAIVFFFSLSGYLRADAQEEASGDEATINSILLTSKPDDLSAH
jgi:hypothetical protein